MSKVINFFGKLDDGGFVLDLQLHPKRMKNFKSFKLEDYNKAVEKAEKEGKGYDLDLIDKYLFGEDDGYTEKEVSQSFAEKIEKVRSKKVNFGGTEEIPIEEFEDDFNVKRKVEKSEQNELNNQKTYKKWL